MNFRILSVLWIASLGVLVPAAPAAAADAAEGDEAAATLRISVVDGRGAPVADARVTLVETRRSVFADDAGTATFDDVAPGDYHVEATSPRLGTVVAEVALAPGEARDLRLEMTRAAHQERIVVTATPRGRGSAEVVVPILVLGEEELSEAMQPTLGETLAQEPGIHSTFFGAGASRPIIRGQGGGRVRILEGGLGVGDASTTSPDHAVTLDPLTADAIEIVRGPAALLYDTGAIGGLVNVLDDRIPDHAPRDGFAGAADLRLGTVADERSGAVDLDGGTERFAWHFDGALRDADDYEIPGRAVEGDPESASGALPNSSLESTTLTAGASVLFERGFVGVSVRGFDTDYGIQEIELEPTDAPPAPEEEEGGVRIEMQQRRLDLRGELGFDAGPFDELRFGIGATDYEHTELEGGEPGTTFLSDSREARVELAHHQGAPRSGVVGVQVTDREAEALGEEAFLPEVATDTLAVFALQELPAGPVRFELGGRWERTDHGIGAVAPEFLDRVAAAGCSAPRDADFDALSTSAGVIWLSERGWGVGASVTRAVRAPAAEELYSCGPHLATQSFEVGNADLDEETGLALDVSLRRRTGRLTGEITLFANRFDDYIYEEYGGVIRTPEGEAFDTFATTPADVVLPEFRFTQADAEFWGAELRAMVELFSNASHHAGLEITGDFVRAELRDTGERLPRIPADRFGIGLHYQGPRWYGSASVRTTDEQTRLAPSEVITDPTPNGIEGLDLLGGPTESYTLVQALVGFRIVRRGLLHDVSLRGTNLTDEEARVHTSRLKNVAPLPGVDVALTYRLVF